MNGAPSSLFWSIWCTPFFFSFFYTFLFGAVFGLFIWLPRTFFLFFLQWLWVSKESYSVHCSLYRSNEPRVAWWHTNKGCVPDALAQKRTNAQSRTMGWTTVCAFEVGKWKACSIPLKLALKGIMSLWQSNLLKKIVCIPEVGRKKGMKNVNFCLFVW